MKTRTKRVYLAALTGLAAGAMLAVGCGGSSSSSSSRYTCCINGAFYECPSSDAVSKCGQGDSSACTRDSSNDAECDK